jgi:carbonic anhydrase
MRADAFGGQRPSPVGRRRASWPAVAARAAAVVVLAAVSVPPAGAQPDAHWSYAGPDGPDHWGELSDAYRTCATGHEQSPIDIWRPRHAGSAAPLMQYAPSPLRVENDGHTLRVTYAPGSRLVTDGKTYELVQLQFHSPSEHRIRGQGYAMEADLVHKADDGSLAVVALLLDEGPANPFLERVLASAPAEAGGTAEVPGAPADVAEMVPGRSGFFYYNGSLTTPPCSEGVRWFVMDAPGVVSKTQVARFVALVHENARPVQPTNGRPVEHRM